VIYVSQPGLKKSTNTDTTAETQPQSGAEVMYTTVYTFVIYDHDKGTTVIHPRMATRQTIANMRGKVNEETAWVVEVGDLDPMGFYIGEKTPNKL
jgi:hypothetical protein